MKVTSYQQLNTYFNAFAEGHISLLIVQSRGGLSKSHTAKDTLKDHDIIFFNGHATPLSIYMDLFNRPHSMVCFDDCDALLQNKVNLALLKQIAEIDEEKTIRYNTTVKINKKVVPQSFKSTSKVLLLVNDLNRLGKNMKALLTRGVLIDFVPSNEEVLAKIKSIPDIDKEVYGYLHEKQDEIEDLNLRTQFKCQELKESKVDWQQYLRSEHKINIEDDLVLQIMDKPALERDLIWQNETGKSVRTLRRLITKIQKDKRTG